MNAIQNPYPTYSFSLADAIHSFTSSLQLLFSDGTQLMGNEIPVYKAVRQQLKRSVTRRICLNYF